MVWSKRGLLAHLFILIFSVTEFSEAFHTPALSHRTNVDWVNSLRMAATVDSDTLTQTPKINKPEKTISDKNVLKLDQNGRLRIKQGPVLLDGLDPSIWTGIPSVYSTQHKTPTGLSSLFLYTTHSEERAQHELSLGRLATCNRLLACARLTRCKGISFHHIKICARMFLVSHFLATLLFLRE